jgi:hypothetical protein
MPDSLGDIEAGVEEELRPAGITTAAATPPIPRRAQPLIPSRSRLRLPGMLAAPAQNCPFQAARVFIYCTPMAAPTGGDARSSPNWMPVALRYGGSPDLAVAGPLFSLPHADCGEHGQPPGQHVAMARSPRTTGSAAGESSLTRRVTVWCTMPPGPREGPLHLRPPGPARRRPFPGTGRQRHDPPRPACRPGPACPPSRPTTLAES